METKIIKSYSLITFAKTFGPSMQVAPNLVNSKTGETFTACVFKKGDDLTFVSFSSNLGTLTPAQIAQQKDTLQVVQLESGNYCLCKQGGNSWLEVDLGL